MRKNVNSLLAFLTVASLLILSCKNGITFKINHDTTFTVPSTVGVSLPISIPTPDVETNSEQEFEKNDTQAKWVKAISLEEIKLTIENPVNEDFSFLKSVYLYMNADGLDEVEVASLENIDPNVGNSITLVSTMVDLAEYIKKEKYTLRARVITDESIFFDITIKTDLRFSVSATIPGL